MSKKLSAKERKNLWLKIINEGDSKVFYHHGLKCQILRHTTMGHLCGYVFSKEGVEHWRYEYEDDDTYYQADTSYGCHGGITFDNSEKLGFDCAHLGDMSPYNKLDARLIAFDLSFDDEVYQDMAYVKMEVKNLADQIYRYNLTLKKEKKNKKK